MSESKTPTPRTDAEAKRQENWSEEVHADTYDCWMETFRFARSLESELNEALKHTNNQSERINELIKICEEWRTDYTKQSAQLAAAQAELNEANEAFHVNAEENIQYRKALTTAQQEITELRKQVDADKYNREMWARIITKWNSLCTENDELKRDKERLIEHFINRADCAADNMEGTSHTEFINYETRMICAVETLEQLGVKYDPITGIRQAIDSTTKGTKE